MSNLRKICRYLFSKQKENVFNVFEVKNPNYDISPYRGMTRQHWDRENHQF